LVVQNGSISSIAFAPTEFSCRFARKQVKKRLSGAIAVGYYHFNVALTKEKRLLRNRTFFIKTYAKRQIFDKMTAALSLPDQLFFLTDQRRP
jgi:hypothetical protein